MVESFTLNKPFALEGHWWIPSEPSVDSKYGVLTFEPGQYITLQLDDFERLSKSDSWSFGGEAEEGPSLIRGKTRTGYSIILLKNKTFAFNRFYPQLVMISDLGQIPWNDIEEIKFHRLAAQLSYLENWYGHFPFSEHRDQDKPLPEITVKYISPETLVVPISDLDFEVRFVPSLEANLERTRITLTYRLLAEVVAHKAQPVWWFLDQLQHVQDLLALLVGEEVRKQALAAKLDPSEAGMDVGLYIHILHSVPIPNLRGDVPASMISASTLGESLLQVTNAWFRPETRKLWDVVRDNFFGVFYGALDIPHYQFLALVQALESYHRTKFGGKYMCETAYEPVREALVRAIPSGIAPDHRDSLKSRIKYGNEYSLQKRLTSLLNSLDQQFQAILRIEKPYLRKIVDTRNYYIHYDQAIRSSILQDQELAVAISRLAYLMLTLLLKDELLIREDLILELLKRARNLGRLW
ncbi:MAG: hypothetical protein Kow00106_03210 [Anaerolineae bacterium]